MSETGVTCQVCLQTTEEKVSSTSPLQPPSILQGICGALALKERPQDDRISSLPKI